jgi:ATP-dependent DNA helicase DinG
VNAELPNGKVPSGREGKSARARARVPARERLRPEACGTLREAIGEAGGSEVFAIGHLDHEGLIDEIEIVARGGQDAVPALAPYFEKASVLIHNHPSGRLFPSEADIGIAAEAGSYGVGSYIIDNEVAEVYVVAEPARRKAFRQLDEESLAGALDRGGRLSQKMPAFEPRLSQRAMTKDVSAMFNTGGILAAEAGTGVGKSFAYLVPSIAWAEGNEERVVISTATINLQDQLFTKDIPLVSSMFRNRPKAVLVKGRSNYLCKRRLSEAITEEGLFLPEDHPLKRIKAWDASGALGDRAGLPFRVDDATWNRVCSEVDTCISIRCPDREKCHILLVRKEAADARIIVVNHHLLFADIAQRQRGSGVEQTSILPAYSALVLDEAHSMESSATSLFTESFQRFSVLRKLSRLYRRTRNGQFGAIARIATLQGVAPGFIQGAESSMKAIQGLMAELEASALSLFGSETSIRLKEKQDIVLRALCEPAGRLQRAILALTSSIADVTGALEEEQAQDPAVYEARLMARSLNETADLLARLKDFDANPDMVFWLEKSRTSQKEAYVEFNATPLEVAPILERSVFGKIRTVVCCSATLSIGGSFEFWMRRVGISKERDDVETRSYPSPFPFSSNAELVVDSQAPHPQRAKEQFKIYAADAVARLLVASRGRALVLFTSYDLLAACYEKAKPVMDRAGISCLRQGMDDRSRLLSMFRNDLSSVLFATDSFWEGVDAPGETLSMVVITKLPFKVPSDPIQQARSEAVEKRGGSSFMEISVPEAIIKFKQGFGRLIRHSEDRGIAVVLDQRLATSRYGQLFVESLPRCKVVMETLPGVEREVQRFLDA